MNHRHPLLLAAIFWLNVTLPVGGQSIPQPLPAGTVILSINNHDANDSPGFFNHMGLYDGCGHVIESQAGIGVQAVPLADYWRRDYTRWLLYPRSREVGERAAAIARTYVGRPYRRASSLAPLVVPPIVPTLLHGTPDGMNCTSVISESYGRAIGRPLVGFRIPDDAMRRPDLFTNIPPQ